MRLQQEFNDVVAFTELPEVEQLLSQKNSVLSRSYLTNLGLYIIGVLRRFHCCLLLSPEATATAFESLCRIVKHVTNPADCSSAERCILAYLYDLYSCCSFLKVWNGNSFLLLLFFFYH